MSTVKYTKDHEWLKVDGDVAWVGITTYARHALGDLVFLELPETGRNVKKGDDFAVVESVKAASEIYTPVSRNVRPYGSRRLRRICGKPRLKTKK